LPNSWQRLRVNDSHSFSIEAVCDQNSVYDWNAFSITKLLFYSNCFSCDCKSDPLNVGLSFSYRGEWQRNSHSQQHAVQDWHTSRQQLILREHLHLQVVQSQHYREQDANSSVQRPGDTQ